MHLRLDTHLVTWNLVEVNVRADFRFARVQNSTIVLILPGAMISLCILSALIGCCIGTPLTAVWLSPIAPVSSLRQYQSQDGLGGYHYAYTGPHHSKAETRLGGMTEGGYSYIDANGILQTVAYTADALNGFRVHASNLPQQPKDEELTQVKDTQEVADAKRTHFEEVRRAEVSANQASSTWQVQNVASNPDAAPQSFVDYSHPATRGETNNQLESERQEDNLQHPFLLSKIEADKISKGVPILSGNLEAPSASVPSSNYIFQKDGRIQGFAPLPANIHPHYVFPVSPYRLMHSSLRHTQDSLGQYDYTYTGDTSAKTESRSLDGTTRGAYSYIDANGLLQQVHYIADHNGFRVAATNLPEAK